MPVKNAPRQGLPYGWVRGEDFWGGPLNDVITFLDSLYAPVVQSITYSSPPPEAQNGWCYIVAANPTGAWAGTEGQFAVMIEGAWRFFLPRDGWRIRIRSLNGFYWYNVDHWENEITGQDPENPDDPDVKPIGFDIAATVSDKMYADEPIIHLPMIDPCILPANMADSLFDMLSASQNYAQMRVQRNGTNVGTITVQQGSYSAVFATASGQAVTFARGDRLTIRAPSTPLDTFMNFGFVIRLRYL